MPARLTAEQAAWVLNCRSHDLPILVAAKLLKPLGNPPPNGIKFFATADLLELVKDRAWLVKVTNAVNQHWHVKNALRRNGAPDTQAELITLATTGPAQTTAPSNGAAPAAASRFS